MTRTVIALYDNMNDANSAIRELVDNNFKRDDISMMAGDQSGEYGRTLGDRKDENRPVDATTSGASGGAGVGASVGAAVGGIGGILVGLGALVIPGIGPVIAAGPLAAGLAGLAGAGAGALAGGVAGGLIGALVDVGVPEETAKYYTEGVRRGGLLVSVRTDDTMSGQAVSIMNRYNPIDINNRVETWRSQGWNGTTQENTTENDRGQQPINMPQSTDTPRDVVDRGGMHPLEEQYGVEQNIPTTGDRDRTYGSGGSPTGLNSQVNDVRGEDTQMSGLTGRDYQNTGYQGEMRPTGTDYDSTNLGSNYGAEDQYRQGQGKFQQYDYYDTGFNRHFSDNYGSSYSYDQYRPVYRYGYDLATDPRYSNRHWEDIEPEARNYWDERQPGTWDRIKDSVRYAWDEVKKPVS